MQIIPPSVASFVSTLLSGLTSSAPIEVPAGRLSPQTNNPLPTAAVSASGTVFYTPYVGAVIPIYNGSSWKLYNFTELSNVLANAATGKAGPAAAIPNAVYDLFAWDDAGTLRLTRGPVWSVSATVTMTIAAPCVVTWTGHGLQTGMVVQFTTTGALPTGVSANTDYFITRIDANSFRLSTTLANCIAGTFVTSSGTQSGVHTGFNFGTARGTGAGTSELTRLNGLLVNANAVTNGPAAQAGIYLGSIMTDSAGATVTWSPGSAAAGGGAATFGIWNAFNRRLSRANVQDTTASWTYNSATVRTANASSTDRIDFVRGLQEDEVEAAYRAFVTTAAIAASFFGLGVGLNTPAAVSGMNARHTTSAALAVQGTPEAPYKGNPPIGFNRLWALENGDGTGNNCTVTANNPGLQAFIGSFWW